MTGPTPGPASDTDGESDTESKFEGETEHTSRTHPRDVTIEAPPVETAEYLATWWVALADEQRVYDSHLLGEPNRALIREAMARHIVTDGLLVARAVRRESGTDEADTRDTDDTVDENWTLGFEADDGIGVSSGGTADTKQRNPVTGKRETPDGRAWGDTDARSPMDRSSRADDGAIVGFVMFGPETGSYEQSVDRGIIENVFVHADYRNRGIGGVLLDAAERALTESGVDVIALEAMATNEAARRLYARRGYRPHRVELEAPVERLESVERAGENGPSGDDPGDDAPGERGPETDRKR